jgi:hypothetical protein
MLPPGLLLLAACATTHLPASAQMYKWTDAQGTVHYTDTPPPAQKASQIKAPSAGASGQNCKAPCPTNWRAPSRPARSRCTPPRNRPAPAATRAALLLRARGVPYTEKTVNTDEDKEQLRKLAGKLELPLLVVGSRKVAGFQDAAWQDALSSAAYPRSAQLPPGYQYARRSRPRPPACPRRPRARRTRRHPTRPRPGPPNSSRAARPREKLRLPPSAARFSILTHRTHP